MPEGPATGRGEAKQRALTTPSTAPASKTRCCDGKIWIQERDVPPGNTSRPRIQIRGRFVVASFPRISTRRRARGRRVRPAQTVRADSDMQHDQRWRERPRLDGLGSLAGQDGGGVHAIVGSLIAPVAPTATAAQCAASKTRSRQVAAIETLAHGSRSWGYQG
jgi:hypothetical protein